MHVNGLNLALQTLANGRGKKHLGTLSASWEVHAHN